MILEENFPDPRIPFSRRKWLTMVLEILAKYQLSLLIL